MSNSSTKLVLPIRAQHTSTSTVSRHRAADFQASVEPTSCTSAASPLSPAVAEELRHRLVAIRQVVRIEYDALPVDLRVAHRRRPGRHDASLSRSPANIPMIVSLSNAPPILTRLSCLA